MEGPDELYQITTSAFHCILSGCLNEAAYNTYSTGVMEIRIAGSSCRRPQLLFYQIYLIITLGCDVAFYGCKFRLISPGLIHFLKVFLGGFINGGTLIR